MPLGAQNDCWQLDLDSVAFAIELRAILTAVIVLLLVGIHAMIYCSVPVTGEHVHTTGLFILAFLLAGGKACGAGRRLGAIRLSCLAPSGSPAASWRRW